MMIHFIPDGHSQPDSFTSASDHLCRREMAARRRAYRWAAGGKRRHPVTADLANSYEVVRTMSFAPFSKEAILQLAAATLVPVAPLLLTMMPLDRLLKLLFWLVF
jgi:hypothetical protein